MNHNLIGSRPSLRLSAQPPNLGMHDSIQLIPSRTIGKHHRCQRRPIQNPIDHGTGKPSSNPLQPDTPRSHSRPSQSIRIDNERP